MHIHNLSAETIFYIGYCLSERNEEGKVGLFWGMLFVWLVVFFLVCFGGFLCVCLFFHFLILLFETEEGT